MRGERLEDTLYVLQREVGKVDRIARSATQCDPERIVMNNFESQALPILAHPVQGAAIGMGDRVGGKENLFEQAGDIALESMRGIQKLYLMQTALTCFMSVMPCSTFSMPSCLRVRMPSSRACASSSATRACS